MDSVFPAMMQDYTLLLTKTGDVWFCGENMVSRDDLRSPSRVFKRALRMVCVTVYIVRVRACHVASVTVTRACLPCPFVGMCSLASAVAGFGMGGTLLSFWVART